MSAYTKSCFQRDECQSDFLKGQSISLSGNQLEGNVAVPSSERIDIDSLLSEWHYDEVPD